MIPETVKFLLSLRTTKLLVYRLKLSTRYVMYQLSRQHVFTAIVSNETHLKKFVGCTVIKEFIFLSKNKVFSFVGTI